jgi:hypothetical protein
MNCPACGFPIPSTMELIPMPSGQRVIGVVCTHCERASMLIETIVRPPKYSAAKLAEKQNRNS